MTCAKQLTVAIIVNGLHFYLGTNYCDNEQEKCPREDMKTGEGYDLCKNICEQKHHAEVAACLEAGEDARGGTLYLIGHSYCCNNCKEVMNKHGIKKVVIV